jgi:hypothetical protein
MRTEASTGSLSGRNLTVALFTETQSVRDAVADLRDAGFGAGEIYVAFSAEHDQFDPQHSELWQCGEHGIFRGEHSVRWRIRHSFERDLHHRTGAYDTPQGPGGGARELHPACTEVNLHDVLKAIGVADDRIWLVNQQVGPHGALILVDSSAHANHAELTAKTILEKNCGQIRTDTATENPPGSWRKAQAVAS